MSTAQSGNLDEIRKLQGLKNEQKRVHKNYSDVASKNKILDT